MYLKQNKMKNFIKFLVILIPLVGYSQSPIIDIYSTTDSYGDIAGAYYKDINDFHNQYVGTWLLNSGGMKFKIILRKKNVHNVTNDIVNYYEDLLIGEYQLIINGVEKVNTLANININCN